jgi:hypothetical protein
MKLQFLPAAREELDVAASYLEDRVFGLGKEFLDDVERTGALLCQFPPNRPTAGLPASSDSVSALFFQSGIPNSRR